MQQADKQFHIIRTVEDLNALYDMLERHMELYGDLGIEVAPYAPKRSNLANRYYWEILSQAGDQSGHTKDELHALMRWKFLGAKHTEVMGSSLNLLPSTTDLNTKEFNTYVRSVETFIMESGFTISAPPYYNDIWGRAND